MYKKLLSVVKVKETKSIISILRTEYEKNVPEQCFNKVVQR